MPSCRHGRVPLTESPMVPPVRSGRLLAAPTTGSPVGRDACGLGSPGGLVWPGVGTPSYGPGRTCAVGAASSRPWPATGTTGARNTSHLVPGGDKPRPYGGITGGSVGEGFMPSRDQPREPLGPGTHRTWSRAAASRPYDGIAGGARCLWAWRSRRLDLAGCGRPALRTGGRAR